MKHTGNYKEKDNYCFSYRHSLMLLVHEHHSDKKGNGLLLQFRLTHLSTISEGPPCVGYELQVRLHADAQGDPTVSPAGRQGTCKHTPGQEGAENDIMLVEQNVNNNKTVTGSGKSASPTLP